MRVWLALWLACPRAPSPAPAPVAASQSGTAGEEGPRPAPRLTVEPGSYWGEAGGLCLEVPVGWRGSAGSEGPLLDLKHEASGVRFRVFAWSATDPPPGDLDVGWVLHFSDDGGYRTVPILSPASTSTWRASAQPGPTRQTWTGAVGGRTVRVEATYPFGASVSGRDEVEPLLEALCTTYQ